MDISIVTVLYNSQKEIKSYLDSIKKSNNNLKVEVILIDNASSDNAAKLASKHGLKPIIIKNKINLGFSKAVNQGIKKANGKYIFLLNPDTRLVGSCLKKLFDFAENQKILGAVAPRLLDNNGKPQPSAFHFPTIPNAIKKYFFGVKNAYGKYLPTNKTQTLDIIAMAAFLIPRLTLEEVGLLDESYFLYYEDIEFCRRLKRKGLPLYYFPQAKVKHSHGASGNFRSHHESPLLKSAITYHGRVGFFFLSNTLRVGEKWQKIKKSLPF